MVRIVHHLAELCLDEDVTSGYVIMTLMAVVDICRKEGVPPEALRGTSHVVAPILAKWLQASKDEKRRSDKDGK